MDASDVGIDVGTLWPTVEWTLTVRRPGHMENQSEERGGGATTTSSSPRAAMLQFVADRWPSTALGLLRKNHMWHHWCDVATWFVPEGKAAAEEILFFSYLCWKGSVDICGPVRFITCDFTDGFVMALTTPTGRCYWSRPVPPPSAWINHKRC